MERPDALEQPDHLKPQRFGHTPALWLVLPLIAGGCLDIWIAPSPLTCLSYATGLLILAGGLSAQRLYYFLPCLVSSTVFISCAWHQLKIPPQTEIIFRPHYSELSIRVEQAHPKSNGTGWSGLGIITEREDPCFRRRISLSVYGPCPVPGAELKISGHLHPLTPEVTSFDRWLRSQGATLKLTGGKNLGVMIPAPGFNQWCQQKQAYLEQWWQTLPWIDTEGGQLLAATMLGRTALLPPPAKAAFTATGTLHLFAISGLHIAGMAAALLWVTQKLHLPKLPCGILILGGLWLYVAITGSAPSSMRAWLMTLFLWAGQQTERATSSLQSLALAGTVTLLLHPEAISDPGFQLSYLAVLALITLGTNLATSLTQPTLAQQLTARSAPSRWQKLWQNFHQKMIQAWCLTAAATLAGLPLSLYFFGQMSFSGLWANLVLIPLAEVPLIFGLASTVLSPWHELLPLAQWLNGVAVIFLQGMTWLAEQFAQTPHTVWHHSLKPAWLGPVGGLSFMFACLALANETRTRFLLGVPLLLFIVWLSTTILL